MTLHQKIFAILASISILIVIIYLVKNGKLREEYSWLWLLTGIGMLFLVIWYDVLILLTHLIGAIAPTTTIFIFAIFFLIFISLHFAIKISRLTNQVKNLAQKISILEANNHNNKGFTLLEIIMILVIIGILSAIIVPKFLDMQKDGKRKIALAGITEVKALLNQAYFKARMKNPANKILTLDDIKNESGITLGTKEKIGDITVEIDKNANGYSIKATAIKDKDLNPDEEVSEDWIMPSIGI